MNILSHFVVVLLVFVFWVSRCLSLYAFVFIHIISLFNYYR